MYAYVDNKDLEIVATWNDQLIDTDEAEWMYSEHLSQFQ